MLRFTARTCFLFTFLLTCSTAQAQTVGAGLQGNITDNAGGAVRQARVQIRNLKTDAIRAVASNEAGRYQAPLLPPGEYELRVTAEGYQPLTQKGITLAVGQEGVVNLRLAPAQAAAEIVTVQDAATVNLTSGALSGLVDDRAMRDLPLNGRSFQQLALLQSGVTAALAAGNDPVGGRTPKIAINGARPELSSFLLDGTDINSVYNKTPGSVAGVLLGVEAVLEFQVLTNSYSAEFGRSAGGVVNAVTRSGSNQVQGSAFEFLRNSSLDARNYFDPAAEKIPAFKRNQFGAAVGGPIRRDKTFFFGAYESLIERLGITGVSAVPDAQARQGILPNRTVTPHPAVPAYLKALFPEANGRPLGGGAAEYLYSRSQPTNEHFAQGRVDHRFGDKDSLFGRYTISNGKVDRQPVNKPPIAYTMERSRNQYVTLEELHTVSASLLNTARLGFNRSTMEAENHRTIDIPPALSWVPGEPFGFLTITGLVTEMGGDYRLPRLDRLNNYQWSDTVVWLRGRHSVRVGHMGQRMQFNQDTISQRGGIVTFTSLENFLQGIAQNVNVSLPGLADPIRGYRQWLVGHFIQDDVRLRPNLVLTAGIRHEFTSVPKEVDGKLSTLRRVTDSAVTAGNPWVSNPSLRNLAPRLGLAWDPFGNGKTSVRAGFGIFYDEFLSKYYFFPGSLNPPFTTRTEITRPPFPNVVANFDPTKPIQAQLQSVNFDLQSPYLMQFNISVERALKGGWTLSAAYAGSRGLHLFRVGDANLAPESIVNGVKVYRPELGRRNRNFTGIWQRVTDAQSFYNSLQWTAVRRFSHGLRAQASYTFSRSVDDTSGINSQDYDNSVQYGMDWYDRKMDRGLSSFHAAHVAVFNWTWDLPLGHSRKGAAGALLKGWQLNNITTVQSGHPFTVRLGFNRSGNLNTTSFSMHERPNIKAGYSNNPILGDPDRYWDIHAFELQPANTRGNLGRNTLIGPGLASVDLSLVKSCRLDERRSLQFRVETFNAANTPNFAVPTGRIAFTNAAGAIAPNWGRISSTVTSSRQIQMGLKLLF